MSCGSVGRVVACDTRDPRFESCHGQIFPWSPDCCCTFGQLYWKDENMYKKCRECTQFYKRGRNFVWKTKQNYLENWPNDHSGSWYKIKINSRHNWGVVQKERSAITKSNQKSNKSKGIETCSEASVTRWLDCCSIFGHFQQWIFAKWQKYFQNWAQNCANFNFKKDFSILAKMVEFC